MDQLLLIGSVTLIHLLAVMSPGPDFIVVMKHALSYSRKVGIWTSLGIGTGIIIHIIYSFVGLGLIISQSELLFSIIKYAGVSYLLYLGIMSVISKTKDVEANYENTLIDVPSKIKAFRIGFLTNVLNPKATLFFLSLFTLVIGPQTSSNGLLLIMGVIMVINTALWFIFLSYIITIKKVREMLNRYQKWFNLIFGVLLIIIALKVAFS